MQMFRAKDLLYNFAFVVTVAVTVGCATTATAPPAVSSQLETQLQARVENEVRVNNIAPGFAVAVVGLSEADSYAAAAGVADSEGRAFTPSTPLRIASNTKTFTAATILRLWEKGQIDLDAPIAGLIDPEFNTMLKSDGYDTSAVTVRHLLMHTSGLPDHADENYINIIMTDPSRQWTRREQVKLLVDAHDPLGPPNGQFSYSDTGYILLGDIIERLTGETLAGAVRRELKFSEIGLPSTWWEQMEQKPIHSEARARQYLSGLDATDWNGSADLYGGGGLIMSVNDLAKLMAALMRGEIFDNRATLETMLKAPGNPFPDKYRLGLFPRIVSDLEAYSHEGFWGTHVIYIPELDVAVAAAVVDQDGYRKIFAPVTQTIEDIITNR